MWRCFFRGIWIKRYPVAGVAAKTNARTASLLLKTSYPLYPVSVVFESVVNFQISKEDSLSVIVIQLYIYTGSQPDYIFGCFYQSSIPIQIHFIILSIFALIEALQYQLILFTPKRTDGFEYIDK